MTLYLTKELKTIFNNLIDSCLTNILLYSEETNGKTLMAKYIANQYYKQFYENTNNTKLQNYEQFYLNLSFSLYPFSKIKESIESYMKKKETIKCKKIIILDDCYYINKIITEYLIHLFSSASDNIVFIIIVQDINTINEFIKSRCLVFKIDNLNQYFYKQITKDKYPQISEENIEKLKTCFNNSIYTTTTFLYYLNLYIGNTFDINKKISQLINNELFDNNNSVIKELVDLTIKKEIKEVLKILKQFYIKGFYSENLLNIILNYILYNSVDDKYKIIFIEEILKSLYNIYKYTDSFLQVNKCFIKIVEKI